MASVPRTVSYDTCQCRYLLYNLTKNFSSPKTNGWYYRVIFGRRKLQLRRYVSPLTGDRGVTVSATLLRCDHWSSLPTSWNHSFHVGLLRNVQSARCPSLWNLAEALYCCPVVGVLNSHFTIDFVLLACLAVYEYFSTHNTYEINRFL